jgi:hypothetical protein
MLVSSCTTTRVETRFIYPRYPILPAPERPTLENVTDEEFLVLSPAARSAIGNNFNKLLTYVKQLEAAIKEYNEFAEEENKKVVQP